MASISFVLQPLNIDDASAIGRLGKAAFKDDRHTMMKATASYDHEKTAQEPIDYYLTVPHKVQCIKAVDTSSGRILGYVFWGFRGYTEETVPRITNHENDSKCTYRERRSEPFKPKTEASRTEEREVTDAEIETEMEKEEYGEENDPIKRLTAITDADMSSWMTKLMPVDTKCMFVVTLSVDPEYASHGVGSALMEWGTSHADRDGVFCWVHASEGSHIFYRTHDFYLVGQLTIDLDEYAPNSAPDNDGIWGKYTFRYMKRLPKGGC